MDTKLQGVDGFNDGWTVADSTELRRLGHYESRRLLRIYEHIGVRTGMADYRPFFIRDHIGAAKKITAMELTPFLKTVYWLG